MSLIKGEYWVTDTNDVVFADGDIGDFNHEVYATTVAHAYLLGMFGLDCPDNGHIDDPIEFIRGAYSDEMEGVTGRITVQVLIDRILGTDLSAELRSEITVLFDALNCGDLTVYFVDKEDWVYVAKDYFSFKKFCPKRLRAVVDAVLSAENLEDSDVGFSDENCLVFSFREEDVTVDFPVKDLLLGLLPEVGHPEIVRVPFVPAPETPPRYSAVRLLDHFSMPTFYQNRKGFAFTSSD